MNDVAFDFERRDVAIKNRQRRLAEMIRNQTQFQENPGRMVSGHYVAPSWAQSLNSAVAPVMDRRNIQAEEQGLERDVGEFNAADRRAAIEHAMARPQGTRAQHTLPPDQAGPSIPAQQPTPQAMAQWAQSGAAIPSRRNVVSKLLADIEVNAPIREEAKAEKRLDREDRQAEARELRKLQEAEYERQRVERGEQLAADRAERARIEQERLADRKEDREARSADRRATIEAAVERATSKEPKAGKTLPAGTVKDLGELDEKASTMSGLKATFKPEYAGLGGKVKNVAGTYIPGVSTESAEWWRDYKKQSELAERHSLFGATLTGSEKGEWNAADINPDMKPEIIERNLAKRAALAKKVYDKALQRYGAAGYNVEGLGRIQTGGATGDFDAPPGKALQVRKFNPATGRLE